VRINYCPKPEVIVVPGKPDERAPDVAYRCVDFDERGYTERLRKFPIDRCRTIQRHSNYYPCVQPTTICSCSLEPGRTLLLVIPPVFCNARSS
jgi:hypothetical protein